MSIRDLLTTIGDGMDAAAMPATRLVVAACPDCRVHVTDCGFTEYAEGDRREDFRCTVTTQDGTVYFVHLDRTGWTAWQRGKRGAGIDGDNIASIMGRLLAPLVTE